MGALGSLDRAVELGRARRQHEQAQAAALALGFEGGVELGTAVDLDGAYYKRHPRHHRAEKSRGVGRGSCKT